MSSILFTTRTSPSYSSNPLIDLPTETLIKAILSQDKDGSLCLKQQTAFDETKARFFRNEKTLKEYLNQTKKATAWEITDERSNQTYFLYYAWGEWNRLKTKEDLYSMISSGAPTWHVEDEKS